MPCPICVGSGFVGGSVAGWLGFQVPQTRKERISLALITGSLTSITLFALKKLADITFCVKGADPLYNVARVSIAAFGMGVAYSLAILALYQYVKSIKNKISTCSS